MRKTRDPSPNRGPFKLVHAAHVRQLAPAAIRAAHLYRFALNHLLSTRASQVCAARPKTPQTHPGLILSAALCADTLNVDACRRRGGRRGGKPRLTTNTIVACRATKSQWPSGWFVATGRGLGLMQRRVARPHAPSERNHLRSIVAVDGDTIQIDSERSGGSGRPAGRIPGYPIFLSRVIRPIGTHSATRMLPLCRKIASCG